MTAPRADWFEVLLGYDCNAVCPFCSQELSWRRRKGATTAQAVEALRKARADGFDKCGFLGGEVLLRPDVETLVRAARRLGFRRVRVLTNGIPLDEARARRLFAAGLDTVHFSVHGDSAALHDRLVAVPGAFRRVERAVRTLKALGADVGIKMLLNKVNAARLPAMTRLFLEEWGVDDLAVTLPLRTGDYLNHASELDLTWTQAVPHLRAALAAWRQSPAAKTRPPDVRNLPPCQMPEASAFNADLLPETDAVARPAEEEGGSAPKRQAAACAGCAWNARCPGADIGYLKAHGEDELKAVAADPLEPVRARVRARDLDGALRAAAAAIGERWAGPAPRPETLGARPDMNPPPRAVRAGAARARAAEALLGRALRRHPWCGELLLLRGAARLALGKEKAALADLDEAVRLAPAQAQAWQWRYLARYRALDVTYDRTMDGYADIKADIDRALELDPDDAHGYALRAELLHDLEQGGATLADLDRALALDPGHSWARLERADMLSELRRGPEAMRDFAVLLRGRSGEPWLRAMRGRAHAKTGDAAAALSDLDFAVRRAPRLAAARAWRGELLRQLGRRPEARRELDAAVRLSPRDPSFRQWRAALALGEGRWADALRDVDAALRFERRQLNLHTVRGQALWMLGRSRAAIAAYDAAHPLSPRSTWTPPPGASRAEALSSALDAAVASRPRDAWARAFRGRVRLEDPAPGSAEAGLADLDAAVALDRRLGWAWAWRGEALRRFGRRTEARRALERAAALSPRSAWARAWLGRVKEEDGLLAQALADYRAACALDPSAGWILAQAGRLAASPKDLERAALLDVKS